MVSLFMSFIGSNGRIVPALAARLDEMIPFYNSSSFTNITVLIFKMTQWVEL